MSHKPIKGIKRSRQVINTDYFYGLLFTRSVLRSESARFRHWQNPGEGTNNLKPRKFVTPEMVNVPPNACLKCASPTHRFQEVDKCVYGKGNLMTRACPNCGEGGHHFMICIKNQKPTIGTPASRPQEPVDANFSKWPKVEANKSMQQANSPWNQTKNGEWLPSLFPH